MTEPQLTLTNLELRESAPDGSEGAGLSHSSEGLFLLHVVELAAAGEPNGILTIVHDAGDHGGRYTGAARSFSQDQWAVALPDLRGHGRSEGERGHSAGLREVVRDLGSVQDHLAYRLPEAPKILVGQGLGALYALAFALEKPGHLAALVLLAPLWEPKFEAPQQPGGLKKFFSKLTDVSPGKTGGSSSQRFRAADDAAAWKADDQVHEIISKRAIEEAARAASDYAPRLSEVDVPVLVLHGSADQVSDPARSKQLEGGAATVKILDGVGHDILHDADAEQSIEIIREWLKGKLLS